MSTVSETWRPSASAESFELERAADRPCSRRTAASTSAAVAVAELPLVRRLEPHQRLERAHIVEAALSESRGTL